MSRTLAERWRESTWQQIGEQMGHLLLFGSPPAVWAAVMLADFPGHSFVAGVAGAFAGVVVREGVDSWPIESWGDALLDSWVSLLGGGLGGMIAARVLGLAL